MTIIVKDPLETTSTLCTTTSVYDSVNDPDLASTTISGLASTLSSQLSRPMVIHMDYTNRYFDSLSVEELYEMEQKLDAKAKELDVTEVSSMQEDAPKVKQLKI